MRDHLSRPLTLAVRSLLESAGLTVGHGEMPTGAGWQGVPGASPFIPYVALYPMGGQLDGAIAYGAEDASARYQLTCVGASCEQAEWCADTARVALLSTSPHLSGRLVPLVAVDALGLAVRDDASQPPLWFVADRFAITTTPA